MAEAESHPLAEAETQDEKPLVPVTVFTGYLGAGKTTIILGLIRSLPKGYNCVWLKNEFGDMEIDSAVAKESNIAVKEIINGCLCCVLVGQLGTALEELVKDQKPDRIIIETSGSAYPAPVAWEIRKMDHIIKLDGIVTVIDAVNFPGYEDKSFTAREQTKYTDLILINKHELVDEAALDKTLDDVYDLNPDTPKVKTSGAKGAVSADLIFGHETKLFSSVGSLELAHPQLQAGHHALEVDLLQAAPPASYVRTQAALEESLQNLPEDAVYRAKGIVYCGAEGEPPVATLFNYVCGRITFDAMATYTGPTRFIFMGEELQRHRKKIIGLFELPSECVTVHYRGDTIKRNTFTV